jgi:hypothetical protein
MVLFVALAVEHMYYRYFKLKCSQIDRLDDITDSINNDTPIPIPPQDSPIEPEEIDEEEQEEMDQEEQEEMEIEEIVQEHMQHYVDILSHCKFYRNN